MYWYIYIYQYIKRDLSLYIYICLCIHISMHTSISLPDLVLSLSLPLPAGPPTLPAPSQGPSLTPWIRSLTLLGWRFLSPPVQRVLSVLSRIAADRPIVSPRALIFERPLSRYFAQPCVRCIGIYIYIGLSVYKSAYI